MFVDASKKLIQKSIEMSIWILVIYQLLHSNWSGKCVINSASCSLRCVRSPTRSVQEHWMLITVD